MSCQPNLRSGWEGRVNQRTLDLIPKKLLEFYEFHEWRNAVAVLATAYPDEWAEGLLARPDLSELYS